MNISFFVPAFNCAKTIEESVDSIMETNFEPGDELIIVNDSSTDDTASTLARLKEKYPHISTFTSKRNKGGAATRNICIENAKHSLLFCLDSDNILEQNSVKPLKNKLSQDGADIAVFEKVRFFNGADKHDTKLTWQLLPVTTLSGYMADTNNPGSSGNYLFTKKSWEKCGGYPEYAGALDTWGFGFMQLANGCKMVSLPNSYYFHRFGTESYYIRDSNARNMSLAALQIILPYRYLIAKADFNYIMSRRYRYIWFDNIKSRPIRMLEENIGIEPALKESSVKKLLLLPYLRRILRKILFK